jgi:acyl-CoA thioester hydrolase
MKKASHELKFRVPFGDVDMMGHVNNARYLTYFETARTGLLLQSFGNFPRGRLGVIIARAEIDYKAPAKWNDELTVRVKPTSLGNRSFVYEYEILNQENELVATGKTIQVAYDYEKGESILVPELARTILLKQIEETKGD